MELKETTRSLFWHSMFPDGKFITVAHLLTLFEDQMH